MGLNLLLLINKRSASTKLAVIHSLGSCVMDSNQEITGAIFHGDAFLPPLSRQLNFR
jgi:hypothetical protein